MMHFVLASALLLFPLHAQADPSGPNDHTAHRSGFGTMVVVDFLDEYIVVGAESKVTDANTAKELPHTCKIAKLKDRGFFAGTGYQIDGIHTAQEISKNGGSYKDMLGAWVSRMTKTYMTLFEKDPALVMWKRRILADGIFGGEEDGNIVAYASAITFDRDNGGFGVAPYAHLRPGMWQIFGAKDQTEKYFHEFFEARTDRAKREFAEVKEIAKRLNATAPIIAAIATEKLIQSTIEWSAGTIPAIGGPISVLEIEKGREGRWFRQPAFCGN